MHASRGTLPCKLRRFFPGANQAEMVQRIARTQHNLAAATPVQATCWNTFFRFYTNALPTDRRLYRAGITPADRRPHAAATRACHFCDLPEGDDLRHIYGVCPAINTALRRAARRHKIPLPAASLLEICTLSYPPPASKAQCLHVATWAMTAVWAVWSERTRHFSALAAIPPQNTIDNRLGLCIEARLPKVKPKRSTPPDVVQLANHPPAHAIAGYCDGSALGNPGPCGAGAHLILPSEAGTATASVDCGTCFRCPVFSTFLVNL